MKCFGARHCDRGGQARGPEKPWANQRQCHRRSVGQHFERETPLLRTFGSRTTPAMDGCNRSPRGPLPLPVPFVSSERLQSGRGGAGAARAAAPDEFEANVGSECPAGGRKSPALVDCGVGVSDREQGVAARRPPAAPRSRESGASPAPRTSIGRTHFSTECRRTIARPAGRRACQVYLDPL